MGFLLNPNPGNNEIDFGLAAGAQYSILEKVNIGFRYTHGFASIYPSTIQFTDENGQPLGTSKVNFQNRAFQLSIGYIFTVVKE